MPNAEEKAASLWQAKRMLSIPANVFARLLCTGGTQTKKETIAGLPASVALQPKQKMQ